MPPLTPQMHFLPPPGWLQDGDIVGQLAGAIEEEIRQLGGGRQPEQEAVLQIAKVGVQAGACCSRQATACSPSWVAALIEPCVCCHVCPRHAQEESLDLASLHVDPEAPSIWFSAGGSQRLTPSDRLSSRGSRTAAGPGADAGGVDLATESPFYTAGGGSSQAGSTPGAGGASIPEGLQHAAAVEQAAALATAGSWERISLQAAEESAAAAAAVAAASMPSPAEVIPPADEAAAAAVAEVAAAAAAAAEAAPQPPAKAASGSAATASVASSRLDLRKQLTLKYPVVITPSGKPVSQGGWQYGGL